ncbi:MAG: perosamine synthetase [Alphaproteobacteria bacterium 16-39-46]|nr:MAG: perosamine synthetase [Alphaproteobacteria bacterium 16-39-46]OZA44519.1 MAG: perosamine synthetase [Alphaproteobacteria bacterium 17-39-52]HQS83366.1 DegT/DnrJ/EryC1/StrS family aminotransferase [Alphaproteobacteria bacterium]HQS93053.1 DegT/DnrJ/EryC1/StrS family aminotransferase [Alphaproteobacteria bacterium]
MTSILEKIRNIPIAVPSLGDEEWQAMREPLLSGWLTQGPKVLQFEEEFAKLHDVKHALAVTSCTTGLHLALKALGVGPGDEVIIPAFTWVATANVVLYCGATPIFCDVDEETFNIKVSDIPSKITERTKVIIPVHLFGLCADIHAIRSIVPSHIKILEDAACAAGASYKGLSAGSLGDMAVFSFHPRKSITTGEGGMVTTQDKELNRLSEIMRNHGAEVPEEVRHSSAKPYLLPDFKMLGYNYRMTDLQAAVGLVQLQKLHSFIRERQTWAEYYTEKLQGIRWLKPQATPDYATQHAWQAYVCYVDPDLAPMPRNDIMDILQKKGIATRPGTHAVHMLSFYKDKYRIKMDDFPGAKACDHNTMAIPLHNKMTQEDFDYVIEALKAI